MVDQCDRTEVALRVGVSTSVIYHWKERHPMTTPYSTGAFPAQPGSSVVAGPAQQMLLAAATPHIRPCDPGAGGAGFSSPLADGAR